MRRRPRLHACHPGHLVCRQRRRSAGRRDRAHHRTADRHQASVEPDLVARRHARRVHVGSRRHSESLRRRSVGRGAEGADLVRRRQRRQRVLEPRRAARLLRARRRSLAGRRRAVARRRRSGRRRGRNRTSCCRPTAARVAFVRPATGAAGADLWIRTLADGNETARRPRRHEHRRRELGARRRAPRLRGGRAVDPARADAGLLGREDHLHDHRAHARRRPTWSPPRGGKPRAIGTPGGGGVRWIDPARVVFDRTSPDFKRRTIYIADVASGAPQVAREDVDEKFWSIPGDAGVGGAAVARRQVDRVSERSRRLGSPLRDAGRRRRRRADHQGQVRGVAAVVVARQHADGL